MDLDELLKSIREEDKPKKSGAIVPAKLFGKNRYEAYLGELTSNGTIGGNQLSTSERKEGFKKRTDKIGFEKFVDKVLAKKKPQDAQQFSGNGSGKGAIVKSIPGELANFIKSPVSEETQENFDDILKGIDSILDTLKADQKIKKKSQDIDRKEKEKEKRKEKEKKLESNVFKGLGKSLKKVVAPVKSLFEKLFDFLGTILLGRILVKFIDWFGDEENKGKVDAIKRFLNDTWPALVAGVLLFGTGVGRFITRLTLMIGGWIFKLGRVIIPKLVSFIAKHPVAAAVTAIIGGAAIGGIMQSKTPSNDPERAKEGKTQLEDTQDFGGITGAPISGDMLGFAAGGQVPGVGNKDTIPAMLTPGEFVVSKGAVNKFGVDTFESMNAMGGGTNRPMIKGGITYAQGGGYMRSRLRARARDQEKKNEMPVEHEKLMEQRTESKKEDGILGRSKNFFAGVMGSGKKKNEGGGDTKGGISKNAKALLNMIRWAEGTLKPDGYNTWFGGRSDMDLTSMTINEVVAEQKKRLSSGEATYGKYTSAAVGAYQMMEPEVFASAAGLTGDSKFTPENQDKMAIVGYMMGQAGMSAEEIDAPISREQIAKMAPVWASLPMMNGQSRYGQPVKRYKDLVAVYEQNQKGLDSSSFTATTGVKGAPPGGGGGYSSPSGTTMASSGGSGEISLKPINFADVQKSIDMPGQPISMSSLGGMDWSSMSADLNAAVNSSGPGVDVSNMGISELPNFDATVMQSSSKVKTLGLSV